MDRCNSVISWNNWKSWVSRVRRDGQTNVQYKGLDPHIFCLKRRDEVGLSEVYFLGLDFEGFESEVLNGPRPVTSPQFFLRCSSQFDTSGGWAQALHRILTIANLTKRPQKPYCKYRKRNTQLTIRIPLGIYNVKAILSERITRCWTSRSERQILERTDVVFAISFAK
jgi:hypothetical protein